MRVFEGRTAVITGAGTGVGAAVALALAKAGASVHLIGRRLDKLQATAAKARNLGSYAVCYSCDLAAEFRSTRIDAAAQSRSPAY